MTFSCQRHSCSRDTVTTGDRVTNTSNVQLGDSITLEDDVAIGANATFTNDKFPHSKIFTPKRTQRPKLNSAHP